METPGTPPERRFPACLECGSPSAKPYCPNCMRLRLFTMYGQSLEGMLQAAKGAGVETVYWTCEAHGMTFFSVRKGDCLLCRQPKHRGPKGFAPRVAARDAGETRYQGVCAIHGKAPHSTNLGKCLTCFTASGMKRKLGPDEVTGNPIRAEARRSGAKSYPGACTIHGTTPFGTNTGKCLRCFNAMGYKRPVDRG